MTTRHVIISGASIAGLSTAFWMARCGWRVTVLERAERFRDGGQNVDVRGVAHEVVERMGVLDAIRAANTTETGTVLVDERGRVRAELPSDGPDGATAELEVLRGDFARVLLDALPEDVEIRYGDPIARVQDGEHAVSVTTESGHTLTADLLVVAEGVRSRTRGMVFGDAVDRRSLGVTMAFGTIPRTADDDDRWRWLTTTAGRQVHLRPDPYGTTRAILAYTATDGMVGLSRDAVLDRLRERYAGVAWETPRVLDGFAASDDLYVDDLEQVRVSRWRRGRVVLTGDAGWCVTPMGGGGASLAVTAGYVLAASLGGQDRSGDRLDDGLAAYEAWMRPLVDDVQDLPRGITHFAYPQSRAALALRRVADAVLLSKPFRPLAAKLTEVAQTDRELPVMPH
jgi:2-polyprenyl-6-methoxyphenol hydroxylase-like FAD-dependent oxidoreductase